MCIRDYVDCEVAIENEFWARPRPIVPFVQAVDCLPSVALERGIPEPVFDTADFFIYCRGILYGGVSNYCKVVC